MIDILKIGDETDIVIRKTNDKIRVVITNIKIVDGYFCYFIRRKDNKAFPKLNKYNVWIKGEKVEEVITDEQIKQ